MIPACECVGIIIFDAAKQSNFGLYFSSGFPVLFFFFFRRRSNCESVGLFGHFTIFSLRIFTRLRHGQLPPSVRAGRARRFATPSYEWSGGNLRRRITGNKFIGRSLYFLFRRPELGSNWFDLTPKSLLVGKKNRQLGINS